MDTVALGELFALLAWPHHTGTECVELDSIICLQGAPLEDESFEFAVCSWGFFGSPSWCKGQQHRRFEDNANIKYRTVIKHHGP